MTQHVLRENRGPVISSATNGPLSDVRPQISVFTPPFDLNGIRNTRSQEHGGDVYGLYTPHLHLFNVGGKSAEMSEFCGGADSVWACLSVVCV